MCVIGLAVVAVSCSPPVSLDKLTILFMLALPLLLFLFHYTYILLGSPNTLHDGPELNILLHCSHLVENFKY